MMPRTASPRNSRRSLVGSPPRSYAYERCVSASPSKSLFRNRTPTRCSSGVARPRRRPSTFLIPSLDGHRLTAGVRAAVWTGPVRQLGLLTLGALGVRRHSTAVSPLRLAAPGRGPRLLPLRNGHLLSYSPI